MTGATPVKRYMVDFVFLSEKGKRDNLEDFYGDYKGEFFVVADGLGGHPAGEVASKIGVEAAIEVYKDSKEKRSQEFLEELFRKINEEILENSRKHRERLGMATTMLVAALNNNSIVFANVGDCRAYLFSEDKLEQVTSDDRDEVGSLLRALGAYNKDVTPQITEKKRKSSDLVLMCSDGLHDFVSDEVIKKILASEASLEDKAKSLIETSLQSGSTDNVTVGLMKI